MMLSFKAAMDGDTVEAAAPQSEYDVGMVS